MNSYQQNWPRQEAERHGYIRTASGRKFWPLEPKIQEVQIQDIAVSLSNTARWGGHCKFYSVAQHAVRCAEQAIALRVPEINPYRMLHHDDSEGYLTDLPAPIKRGIPGFKRVEDGLMTVIALALDFAWPMTHAEHDMDSGMLVAESRFLFPATTHEDFPVDPVILKFPIDERSWEPEEARRNFLWMHDQLCGHESYVRGEPMVSVRREGAERCA